MSRADWKKTDLNEEQERSESEYVKKADEASNKALRIDQIVILRNEVDENNLVFGDDDDDVHKSLKRGRKLVDDDDVHKSLKNARKEVLKRQDDYGTPYGQESKVIFTEIEEFVWGLQLHQDAEDVFMEKDVAAPVSLDEEQKVKDNVQDKKMADEDEEVKPDETIHENALGKGLSGALQLLKHRGTLNDSVEWGGRNTDKKKCKLVGIVNDNDDKKEIRIERTDEYGRTLTPKEAFRLISHKFHGKGPGKTKREKHMRQYHEELKLKHSDTLPSLSVERMKEAQSKMKTPYLVLSRHVKPAYG